MEPKAGSRLNLARDVKSMFRDHVYGHAGEEVAVVAFHGVVAIVESKSGDRFPVRLEDLGLEQSPQPPVPSLPKPSRRKIRIKAVPPEKPSLF